VIDLLQQGVTNAWFFVPTAVLLGALHGLEPGHSKTLMAAFIVAIRGTAAQALLLGIAATLSHTLIVWIVALGGMAFFQNLDVETVEPYFQFASGLLIVGVASWMAWRTWRDQHPAHDPDHGHDHGHDHGPGHAHDHGTASRTVDTGHGVLALAIDEVPGASLHWSIRDLSGHGWNPKAVRVETQRPDGRVQTFSFTDAGGYLRSVEAIPEPVDFTARLRLGHGDHEHAYSLPFAPEAGHEHPDHEHPGLDVTGGDFADAHARAHAEEIRRRFASSRNVTTGQIILFGLTGGLIPCPAAITVLLLCLQLQQIWLGALLVFCFSVGLAATLVAVGIVAAVGVGQASKRLPWFDTVARRAPYLSSALIVAVGIYVAVSGWIGLTASLT
jgi:nickel/cobalt exporter